MEPPPAIPVTSKKRSQSQWHLGFAIATTLIYAAAACIVAIMVPFGVMAFDSGVSTPALVFFFGLLVIPVMLLIGIVMTWIGYVKISTRMVSAGIALPILYLALYFAVIMIASR